MSYIYLAPIVFPGFPCSDASNVNLMTNVNCLEHLLLYMKRAEAGEVWLREVYLISGKERQ
jgi:hypothetical protein